MTNIKIHHEILVNKLLINIFGIFRIPEYGNSRRTLNYFEQL